MNHRAPGGAQAELLRAALSMAARGWHVFPCAPGRKHPALRASWQEIATTDSGRVCRWWRRIPYNIAVACGPSGLVVLDLDVAGHGAGPDAADMTSGVDQLAYLCRQHGKPYPDSTFSVRTPSGGQHFYFRSPDADTPIPNSAGKLAPLIDVRGAGGYVIGHTSCTVQGRYEIARPLPPAPLPSWISDLARRSDPPPMTTTAPRPISDGSAYGEAALGYEAEEVARAVEHTRNDTLFKSSRSLGQLVAGGVLHANDVRATLAQAAQTAGLPLPEITRTIESGLRSGARMPRGLPTPSLALRQAATPAEPGEPRTTPRSA